MKLILNAITTELERDGRVEIRKFGTFTTRLRRARIGRNPKLGSAWTYRLIECRTLALVHRYWAHWSEQMTDAKLP